MERSEKSEFNYYILFANYTQGLALLELLREEGFFARITPVPRSVEGSTPCGMALLVTAEQIDGVREFLKGREADFLDIVETPCLIRPDRNSFC